MVADMDELAPHLRALDALLAVACAPPWPSQAAICTDAQVQPTALYHALAGRRPLPEDAFNRICETLGVDPESVRGIDTPHLRAQLERLERQIAALVVELSDVAGRAA